MPYHNTNKTLLQVDIVTYVHICLQNICQCKVYQVKAKYYHNTSKTLLQVNILTCDMNIFMHKQTDNVFMTV